MFRGIFPVRAARVSAVVVVQPCRRRGVEQLSRRAARGCLTAREGNEEGKPPGAAVRTLYAPTHVPLARGGWCLPHPCAQLAVAPGLPPSSVPTDSNPPPTFSFALRPATPRGLRATKAPPLLYASAVAVSYRGLVGFLRRPAE